MFSEAHSSHHQLFLTDYEKKFGKSYLLGRTEDIMVLYPHC